MGNGISEGGLWGSVAGSAFGGGFGFCGVAPAHSTGSSVAVGGPGAFCAERRLLPIGADGPVGGSMSAVGDAGLGHGSGPGSCGHQAGPGLFGSGAGGFLGGGPPSTVEEDGSNYRRLLKPLANGKAPGRIEILAQAAADNLYRDRSQIKPLGGQGNFQIVTPGRTAFINIFWTPARCISQGSVQLMDWNMSGPDLGTYLFFVFFCVAGCFFFVALMFVFSCCYFSGSSVCCAGASVCFCLMVIA